MKFFKGLWKAIKVLLVLAIIGLVVWVGYNIYATITGKNTTAGFNTITEIFDPTGGKGNGENNGEADKVDDETKGKIEDITDDELSAFEEYIDLVNDGTGDEYIRDEDTGYFDYSGYIPKDIMTAEEFKLSNGNILKPLKYCGRDYLYYSICFYTDENKSDTIRFYGYYPATAFKFDFEDGLQIYLASTLGIGNVYNLFKVANDLNTWYFMKFPHPEISYHYFSNMKKVYTVEESAIAKSAYLNFDLDKFNLYLNMDDETLKVVRGKNKFLLLFEVKPQQYELFHTLAEEFVFSNENEFGKKYNFNFGKHLDYVKNNDRVCMDFLYAEYECPHNSNDKVLSELKLSYKPNCEKDGYSYKLCYCCGKIVVVDKIEKLKHEWDIIPAETTATCSSPGIAKYKCIKCNATKSESVDSLGHFFEYESYNVSCEESVTVQGKCRFCDEETIMTVEIKGHDYSEFVTTTSATCTTQGERTKECSRCHKKVTEMIKSLGHDYGEFKTTVEAKCDKTGSREKTCSRCNAKVIEIIDALGHDYGEFEVVTAPTCSANGTKAKTCSVCNEKIVEEIPKTNKHTYIQVSVVPATCLNEGVSHYECIHCDSIKDESISAIGHNYGEWKVAVEENKAIKFRVCSNCNERETAINDTEQLVTINVGDKFANGSKSYLVTEIYTQLDFYDGTINTTVTENISGTLFKLFKYKNLNDNKEYVGAYSIYKFNKPFWFGTGGDLQGTFIAGQNIVFTSYLASDIYKMSCGFWSSDYPVEIIGLQTYDNIQFWT